jgi:hypothetical protein
MITFVDFPWPMFDPPPIGPSDLKADRIKRFVERMFESQPHAESLAKMLKKELVLWHPDKLVQILKYVYAGERPSVDEGVNIVARTLTILSESL